MASETAVKERKAEVIKQFGKIAGNTGSPEVQIALITDRINHLNGHFKSHRLDHHSKRGLLKLVGQRKRLLTYLRGKSEKRYTDLIRALDLRK